MITCQARGGAHLPEQHRTGQPDCLDRNRGQNGAGEDIAGDVTGFYTTNVFRRNTYQMLNSTTRISSGMAHP